ncbi:MAG: preprotein translocase subunit YajC [Deltaproteobacteria bacterium]|nr:preprotein translocase subunit YajC [Deltaproteobacteria bacterium]
MAGLAYAQSAGAVGGPSPLVSIMPIALMFIVLYFLLIRPQQKRTREHDTMIENLKRNDEIVTTGGMYGRIQSIADKVLVVEIAPNVRVRVDRAQVASVVRAGKPDDTDKSKEKS